jgi:hypothetical protein
MSLPDRPLSEGQIRLGAVLIALPRHRFDAGKAHHEVLVCRRFYGVPTPVLELVADEIEGRCWPQPRHPFALPPGPRPQPRLAEIERMVAAAMQVTAELPGRF